MSKPTVNAAMLNSLINAGVSADQAVAQSTQEIEINTPGSILEKIKSGQVNRDLNWTDTVSLLDLMGLCTGVPTAGVESDTIGDKFVLSVPTEKTVVRITTRASEARSFSFSELKKANATGGIGGVLDLIKEQGTIGTLAGAAFGETGLTCIILPKSNVTEDSDGFEAWKKAAGLEKALKSGNWS